MNQNKKPVIFLAFANDKVDDAMYLRNLPKELHQVREALQPAVKAGLCEVVERTSATVNDIFDTFQDPYYQDRIAVFHYGGHAGGDQLMLETLEGGHGFSYSGGLIPFFGKQKSLKVVFFNGCSSQRQAIDLIEEGVPAVIGTSSAIKDEIATEISGRFYNGLASGLSIEQTWQQTLDILKTKTDTKKSKGLKLRRDKSSDFPWNMYIRQGSEIVKDWNLPMAVNNPLFGLPELPQKFNLPEKPFRFLERYKEEHAEVFFGRGKYIRDTYNRAIDPHASPVILLYGQSGVGKSSMLDSGILPRLNQENTVKYIRRDQNIGMLGTLRSILGLDPTPDISEKEQAKAIVQQSENEFQSKIAPLEALLPDLEDGLQAEVNTFLDRLRMKNFVDETFNEMDNQADASIILKKWKAIEDASGEPLIILLDQVEEIFTKVNDAKANELDEFMEAIHSIFKNPQTQPKGKLILSYRKEFHPEIEESCKIYEIPRDEIFVKQLTKSDIEEVILGLTSSPRLHQRYRLKIEQGLPAIIADDLLEDKESAIAPVLQILLTKMWNMTEQDEIRHFTINNYQELKKEGILMDDFFEQQMEKIRVWNSDVEVSGLALDVLNFHTTRMGTAGAKQLEDIRERYQHRDDILENLLGKFKELYLLTDAGVGKTGLAHDTIAPLVQETVRRSDTAGQRAFRILTNKAPNFERNPNSLLDGEDLHLVEEGASGMRLWTALETDLIEKSRKKREKGKRRRLILRRLAMGTLMMIIGLSIFSGVMYFRANTEKELAEKERIEAETQKNAALAAQAETQLEKERADEKTEIAEEQKKIAEEQKKIADDKTQLAEQEKEKANEQRKIADEKTEIAEKQKQRAEQQTKIADEKTDEAKREQEIAEEQKKIAEKQKQRAEQQTKIAINETKKNHAKVLAGIAITLIQDDKYLAAADSALAAYEANKASGGPEYSSIIYSAMNQAIETLNGKNRTQRNIFAQNGKFAQNMQINPKTDDIAVSLYTDRKDVQINIIKNFNKEQQQVFKLKEEVRSMCFSPNGKFLLAGTKGGKVLGWKYDRGTRTYKAYDVFPKKENNFGEKIQSISFSTPSGGNYYYAVISTPSQFIIYQIGDEGQIFKKQWVKTIKNSTAVLSPKGKYLGVATASGLMLYTTNYHNSRLEENMSVAERLFILPRTLKLAFSHDERQIAYGNEKGIVQLMNTTGKNQMQAAEHKSRISALLFNKNGKQLISASYDGNAKLWNIPKFNDDREDKVVLNGGDKWIYDVAFDSDNHYVYAVSHNGTIRKWHSDIKVLYNELKEARAKRARK
jgi:hypothetical protein